MLGDGNAWRMTACKQKPNMVIAMETYPYFIQPENNEETWLDQFRERILKKTLSSSVRLLKSGQQSMVKIYRLWHSYCNNTERLSHSELLWIPYQSTGLLLLWVRLFIRLCNCTQSGDGGWCVRLSQGHPSTGWEPAITHQPDLAFTCLHPYFGSSMAAVAARKS